MYGSSILLFAACILPLLAAPLPGNQVISPIQHAQGRSDLSLADALEHTLKREPSIDPSSIEVRSDVVIEDKREDLIGVDEAEDMDEQDDIEKRGRVGGSASNGKRGRVGGSPSNGKRGRVGKTPSNGKRGRIGMTPSNGKRDSFITVVSEKTRGLVQRTISTIFG